MALILSTEAPALEKGRQLSSPGASGDSTPRGLGGSSVASSDAFDDLDDELLLADGAAEDDVFPGLQLTYNEERKCKNKGELLRAMVATAFDALVSVREDGPRRELLESGKLMQQMIIDSDTLAKVAAFGKGSRKRKKKHTPRGGRWKGESKEDEGVEDMGPDHCSSLPFAKHRKQDEALYQAFYEVYRGCADGKHIGEPNVLCRVLNDVCARFVSSYESSEFVAKLFSALKCVYNLGRPPKDSHWTIAFLNPKAHYAPRDGASLVDFRRCLKLMGFAPNEDGQSAFDFAIRSGASDYIRACLEHRRKEDSVGSSAKQDALVNRTAKWRFLNASFVRDYLLTREGGRQCLDTLCAALCDWVASGHPVSNVDVFGCVMHDEGSHDKMWDVVNWKIGDVLKYSTLHESTCDWVWFRDEWMNHPLLVAEPSKLEAVEKVITAEDALAKGMEIGTGFSKLIAGSEETWKQLCAYDLDENPLPEMGFAPDTAIRQDMVEFGVAATKSEAELNEINIESSSFEYDALQEYDLQAHVTELVTVAHMLNTTFAQTITPILERFGNVRIGPVKSSERVRAKTQTDYSDSSKGYKFPHSSHVVDLVRCSVTIEELKNLLNACRTFEEECRKSEGNAISLKIMRCKNGFLKYLREDGADIALPSQYCDVKFNVAITDQRRKIAIVGEVQLLLDVILATKLKGHELYEVVRHVPFLKRCHEQFSGESLSAWLLRGGANPKWLTPLLVSYPHLFSVASLSQTVSDSTGLTGFALLAKNASLLKGQVLERLLTVIEVNSTPEEMTKVYAKGGRHKWWLPLVTGRFSQKWVERLQFLNVESSRAFHRRLELLAAYIDVNEVIHVEDFVHLAPDFPKLAAAAAASGDELSDAFELGCRFWTKSAICREMADFLKCAKCKAGSCRLLRSLRGNPLYISVLSDLEPVTLDSFSKLFGGNLKLGTLVVSLFMAECITNVRSLDARERIESRLASGKSASERDYLVPREQMNKWIGLLLSSTEMLEQLPALDGDLRFGGMRTRRLLVARALYTRFYHPKHYQLRGVIRDWEERVDVAKEIAKLFPKFSSTEDETAFWTQSFDFETQSGNLFDLIVHRCWKYKVADAVFGAVLPPAIWRQYCDGGGVIITKDSQRLQSSTKPTSERKRGGRGERRRGQRSKTKDKTPKPKSRSKGRGKVQKKRVRSLKTAKYETESSAMTEVTATEQKMDDEKCAEVTRQQSADATALPPSAAAPISAPVPDGSSKMVTAPIPGSASKMVAPMPQTKDEEEEDKEGSEVEEEEEDDDDYDDREPVPGKVLRRGSLPAEALLADISATDVFSVELPTFQAWIEFRRKKRRAGAFNRRFCRLTIAGMEFFHRSQTGVAAPSKPTFTIPVSSIESVEAIESKSKCKFQLTWRQPARVHRKKLKAKYYDVPVKVLVTTHTFRVPTLEDRDYWLEGIRMHMRFYAKTAGKTAAAASADA